MGEGHQNKTDLLGYALLWTTNLKRTSGMSKNQAVFATGRHDGGMAPEAAQQHQPR